MWHQVSNLLKTSYRKSSKLPKIQDCLNKRYTLYQQEMYDLFLTELGIQKAVRMKAVTYRPTISFTKEGEEYIMTTNYEGERIEKVRFTVGENVEKKNPSGIPCHSIFEVQGNRIIEKLYLKEKEITIWREFRKNEMKVTMKVNNVICLRYFILNTSKHSIETETSRRGSLFRTSTKPGSVFPAEEISIFSVESSAKDTESEIEVCL